MMDLDVPKIIAYLIEHVELFLYRSSFPIHPTQETSILEGVFMEIFSSCLYVSFAWELFYISLIVSAIYVKDS